MKVAWTTLIILVLYSLLSCKSATFKVVSASEAEEAPVPSFIVCDPPRGEGAWPDIRMRGRAFDTMQHHCI